MTCRVTSTRDPLNGHLSVLMNAMGSLKHLWPYFAAATGLMLAALVSSELRENRANNPEMKLGLVADRLAQSIN
jgi:hypothetical protein